MNLGALHMVIGRSTPVIAIDGSGPAPDALERVLQSPATAAALALSRPGEVLTLDAASGVVFAASVTAREAVRVARRWGATGRMRRDLRAPSPGGRRWAVVRDGSGAVYSLGVRVVPLAPGGAA